ncbi:hypothetical protein ACYX34_08705 [Nitrospira sp. CMX1]|nr:hypothetical protein [Nitrospira sp.]
MAINTCVLWGNSAKIPDKTHLKIRGGFGSFVTTLGVEAAAMPGTMIVALLTVLRLSAWAVGYCPLCRQISLSNR